MTDRKSTRNRDLSHFCPLPACWKVFFFQAGVACLQPFVSGCSCEEGKAGGVPKGNTTRPNDAATQQRSTFPTGAKPVILQLKAMLHKFNSEPPDVARGPHAVRICAKCPKHCARNNVSTGDQAVRQFSLACCFPVQKQAAGDGTCHVSMSVQNVCYDDSASYRDGESDGDCHNRPGLKDRSDCSGCKTHAGGGVSFRSPCQSESRP